MRVADMARVVRANGNHSLGPEKWHRVGKQSMDITHSLLQQQEQKLRGRSLRFCQLQGLLVPADFEAEQ